MTKRWRNISSYFLNSTEYNFATKLNLLLRIPFQFLISTPILPLPIFIRFREECFDREQQTRNNQAILSFNKRSLSTTLGICVLGFSLCIVYSVNSFPIAIQLCNVTQSDAMYTTATIYTFYNIIFVVSRYKLNY